MKILHISPTFPPRRFGGVTREAYLMAKFLVQKGHEVTVYTTDVADDETSRLLTDKGAMNVDGIEVHYFRNISTWLAFKHRLYLSKGIFSEIKRELSKFDIVHIHAYRSFHDVIIHHYAMKYNIPYVVQTWGGVQPTAEKQSLKKFFDKLFGNRILRDSSKVLVGGEIEVSEHIEMQVDPARIVVMPPAYNTEEYSQLPPAGRFRHKFNIKEKHIILFLGRLNRIKGIDFLIESFHQLIQERDDVILVLVGPDHGYGATLKRLVDELNLKNKVSFIGLLTGVEKLSALVDATMLVQTSIYERGAGSPFEAILCNTPIIVTKDTGCGEMVAEIDAGYLVEYGNVNELRNLMQRIIDDPSEARNKAQKARQFIRENYSYQRVIEEYVSLYESVIKQRRAG